MAGLRSLGQDGQKPDRGEEAGHCVGGDRHRQEHEAPGGSGHPPDHDAARSGRAAATGSIVLAQYVTPERPERLLVQGSIDSPVTLAWVLVTRPWGSPATFTGMTSPGPSAIASKETRNTGRPASSVSGLVRSSQSMTASGAPAQVNTTPAGSMGSFMGAVPFLRAWARGR